jgi:phosphoglycolate phosphatase
VGVRRTRCTRVRRHVRTAGRQREDAVLFDLDGVLVDSRAAISGAINHALGAFGVQTRPAAELHRFIGPPLAATFAELTGQAADSAAVVACVTAYRERYAESSVHETEVVSGIAEALDDLARDHRLAVATSKALTLAESLLAGLGLRDRFEVVAGPDSAALAEDKSTTIATALAALDAERAVMVGDRSFDVVGAHAHGLAAVGVTWGIGSAHELRRADAIVDAPSELPAVVRELLRPVRAGAAEARA